MSRLALFGGKPVRTEPYPPHNTMIGEDEEREVLEVLRSGHLSGFSATLGERFLGGPKVRSLEAAFAEKFGVKYAVATNSATSALHCAIAALGIGPGDEVITSPFTMCATAAAIVSNGATPVFADTEDETYGLSSASVWDRITGRTKAILLVNLFGHTAKEWLELRKISKYKHLKFIEDNAQSPLSECGDFHAFQPADVRVQSLNFHKFVQTGEGGIALTNIGVWSHGMCSVRNHGEAVGEDSLGGNHRMTELSAAVGIAQLRKLDHLVAIRRELASMLTDALAAHDFLIPHREIKGWYHVYYLYPIKYQLGVPRKLFVKAMHAEGISISEGYTVPTHLLPFYRKRFGTHEGQCPVAERMWKEMLLTTDICKYPNNEREVAQFAEAVKKIADNVEELRSHG